MVIRVGQSLACLLHGLPGQAGRGLRAHVQRPQHLERFEESGFRRRGGYGALSAECPFVYYHKESGYYYLFRTQHYGEKAQSSVYRSRDPMNFGVNNDRFLVGTLPVAAPEIVEHEGRLYIAALLPSLKGIQIAKLKFAPRQ